MESDFPSSCFHSHSTENGRKKLIKIFDNYGLWKSLNVEKIDNEFVVLPRNLRNLKPLTNDEESRFNSCKVLKPIHSFLFLNHPYSVEKIYPELRLVDIFYRQGLKKRRGVGMVTNNIKKENTLALFNPDITHGTMLKLFADKYQTTNKGNMECELDSLFKQVSSTVPDEEGVTPTTGNFLKVKQRKVYFNSSMLDVDSKVLDPIIFEDSKQNAIKSMGNRQFAGSCLDYVKLNNEKEMGILTCPYDDLGLVLAVRLITFLSNTEVEGNAKLHSEIQIPIPHGIFQLQMQDCSDMGVKCVSIAVRSPKSIKIFHLFPEDNIIWNDEEKKLQFVNENVVKEISVIECEESLVHFCLNPMIPNECIFSTETGKICLCSWERKLNKNTYMVLKTKEIDNSEDICLLTAFCETPRTIYIADKQTVELFNIRKKQSTCIFDIKQTGIDYDVIWSIENGVNQNEILILTNFKIYLVDYRQPLKPLLDWCMNTKFASLYISCTSLNSGSDESYVSFAIASQSSQEVLVFQYRTLTLEMKQYAPQITGLPYSIDNFYDTYEKMETSTTKEDSYLQERLSAQLRAVKVINVSRSTDDKPLIVVITLNSLGDLGYQTMQLVEDRTSSEHKYSFGIGSNLKDREMENYLRWSTAALSALKRQTKAPETLGIKCKLTSHFYDRITNQYENKSRNKHPRCSWCNDNKQMPRITENDSNELCALCGYDIYTTSRLGQSMQPSRRNGANVWTDSTSGDVRQLNLIDLDPDKGSDIAKLLKGTWSNSYEEYWNELAKKEKEEKEQIRLSTLDIHSQN